MEHYVNIICDKSTRIIETLDTNIFPKKSLEITDQDVQLITIPLDRELTEAESDLYAQKLANYIIENGFDDFDIEISTTTDLDEIEEKLSHHTYILGNELTLPDIAWFIYVSRLKAARYPTHILHPNVNDWFESLLKREVFAKETKIPRIVRFISYIFYVIQKYSGWSIKRQLVG